MNSDDLIKNLGKVHWVEEVRIVLSLQELLENKGQKSSVRAIAELTHRPKTWIGDSLKLAAALRVFPNLAEHENRFNAMKYLKKKQKQFEFLKSLKLS